ncbi:hypothetical protein ISN44_As06g040810 [Arabidopsis suecica]|uniref:Uncharacterized protein n=1 Tax=Arabidopsis suecica TaxID=45249 RepID=A0A8T2CSR9_ARASU|nr:hypothetical protein ISN44_As06g040810 [Arabidopsis suecica]
MASPLYPSNNLSSSTVVTRDEFNAFHTIDRTLFSRLVFHLNRDVDQSFLAMCFLLFLEQSGYARDVVAYIVSLPDAFVDAVANEIGVCINLLYNLDFASTLFAANNDDNSVIPLLLSMTGGKLTLRLINQDREVFRVGVSKIWTDVGTRAFTDLCERAHMINREKLLALEREKFFEDMKKLRLSLQQENPNRLSFQQENPNRLSVQQVKIASPPPRRPVEDETNKFHKEKEIMEAEEKEAVVAADDRTVFLTFSKGYPISEAEVRVYFTRRFGEVIESVEMQEVEANEQPLFAKMVLKLQCALMMDQIVSARSRNKFTIDGKHVWARKYVRKNPYPASSSTHI